jgi:heme oxygenase
MTHTEPRAPGSSALVALKAATQHEHDALDAALDLMNPELMADQYRRRLAAFLGIYVPLETALEDICGWSEHGIDLHERSKVNSLRADLISLGLEHPDALPVCDSLPALSGIAAAFGSLYVLEGASLGGQIISRHVGKRLGYTATSGAQFFNGYGARTGEMWMSFRRAVDAYGAEPDVQEEMIAGALATFVAFRQWCALQETA